MIKDTSHAKILFKFCKVNKSVFVSTSHETNVEVRTNDQGGDGADVSSGSVTTH